VQGVSLDNELVALFLTAMNASPYFENVELLETQARDVDGYKLNAFEMSATLEGASAPADASPSAPPQQQAPAKPGPAVAVR
jgi:hypothetical protein